MKKYLKYCLLVWIAVPVWAQQTEVIGPDSHLKVNVALKQGKPVYSVTYKEKTILEDSPLGVVTDIGDFSRNMNWIGQKTSRIDKTYTQNKIKKSEHTITNIPTGMNTGRYIHNYYTNYRNLNPENIT